MIKAIKKVHLTNTEFGHNKEYEAELLINSRDEYFVQAYWGKIGGKLASNINGPYTKKVGLQKFAALIAKKKSDGYKDKKQKGKGQAIEVIPGFYQQKAVEATRVEVDAALDDPLRIAEEKFDGSRYFLKHLGNGKFQLHSRRVSVKDNLPVDKTANIPHIIEEMQLRQQVIEAKPSVLDGEIMWAYGNVISVMGAKADKALARQKELGYVYFVVYDLPYYDGEPLFDTPFWKRRLLLETLIESNGPFVRLAKQVKKNKRQFLADVWARGGEGIILKDPDALYQPGARPKGSWIKVKRQLTDEFIIMGYIDGKGKYKDQIGAIVFGQYQGKKLVEVSQCSGFTDKLRQEITDNKADFAGRVIEVEFQERTPAEAGRRGVPSLRHPRFLRFRPDKNAKECVLKED